MLRPPDRVGQPKVNGSIGQERNTVENLEDLASFLRPVPRLNTNDPLVRFHYWQSTANSWPITPKSLNVTNRNHGLSPHVYNAQLVPITDDTYPASPGSESNDEQNSKSPQQPGKLPHLRSEQRIATKARAVHDSIEGWH